MKRTFITAIFTAFLTSICWYGASVASGVRRGAERLWLVSAVKAPGRMALEDIEADLVVGRSRTAKTKIAALRQAWSVFNSEAAFSGQAIGNIMVTFGQIDSSMEAIQKPEPDDAANQSPPNYIPSTVSPSGESAATQPFSEN